MGYTQKIKNGSYRARWTDPSGEWRSKSFATERAARAHLTEVETDIARGQYVDDRDGKTTFASFASDYYTIAERRIARTSFARDKSYLDNHVLPRWGNRQLGSITKPEVERWIAELGDPGRRKRKGPPLAPATIEKIYQVFRKVMAAAVENGLISRLPCPSKPPIGRKKLKPVQFLTEAEIAHLAECIDSRYEAMIYVAGYGGFRIGELVALRLDDVDWARNYIRVDEGLTDVGGILEFEDPKTDRAHRSVPMADIAMSKLREHVDGTVGWDEPSALLFTSPDGDVLRPSNWRRRHFAAGVKEAKLTLTPHDLRHSAASIFIAAGANPWMLAEILGHSDTRMIDRVYGHLFDKDREDLRQRVSERARTAVGAHVLHLAEHPRFGT
jgi:integrase